MANEKYQILTAPKTDDVSLEEAKKALAAQYPAYSVEVHEVDNEFVAKLARKVAAPPKGKVPPFLDEDDDAAPSDGPDADASDDAPDDGGKVPKPPKDDSADDDLDDIAGEPKDKDKGEGGDLGKALKALDTLKAVLPKLETQLKALNGGELPGGLGDGPLGPDGTPPPPGPSGGLTGPSQADLDAVGPTPGKPTPGNAKPMIPGMGGKGPVPPRPGVGVPTFSNLKTNKFVYRPIRNEDGTEVSLAEASNEIASHPRYANYRVHEIKVDDTGEQYIAHLKLNN